MIIAKQCRGEVHFCLLFGSMLGVKSACSLANMMSGQIRFEKDYRRHASKYSGGDYGFGLDSCGGDGDGGD